MPVHIPIESSRLSDFCRRHHIRRLAFFGSVLRDDFRPDSDVDVLVEFDPDHVPGFIRLHTIERELSALLGGHDVDIVSYRYINPRIREQVLATAEVQYAEG